MVTFTPQTETNVVLLNSTNNNGETPLHTAILKNQTRSVKLLLEHGSDPNATDKKGITPLVLAVYSNTEIVNLLLDYGADPKVVHHAPNTTINTEFTVLQHAVCGRQVKTVDVLLDYEADNKVRSYDRTTLLNTAKAINHLEIVSVLLDHSRKSRHSENID